MSRLNALTRAELRLATLLLVLTLLGLVVRGGRRLDPRVEAWLTEPPANPVPDARSPAPPPRSVSAPLPGPTDSRVDPNRADAAELTRLPGVGPVLADRIVRDREQRGSFAGPEDLLRVPGIGPRTLEKIRPGLRFGPPAGG